MDKKTYEEALGRIFQAQQNKKTYKRNGAGYLTEIKRDAAGYLTEIKRDAGPWPCDPLKNRDCTKVNCYLRGGECRLTYRQECRREDNE